MASMNGMASAIFGRFLGVTLRFGGTAFEGGFVGGNKNDSLGGRELAPQHSGFGDFSGEFLPPI
jgi:hypothetical protein